jgi:hypothetical protein
LLAAVEAVAVEPLTPTKVAVVAVLVVSAMYLVKQLH